ncbi:MAG: hypothetical protein KKB13_14605 [Chloroflexi bacterium]|nr:hypothetical protein [Chloroflexota bacterium]
MATGQARRQYVEAQLRLCLLLLQVYGVLRVAHINDQPVAAWGVPLGTGRRPDRDTLDQYLNALIQQDEPDDAAALGQVRPGGLIDTAQLRSLTGWAQAGLLTERVWLFDGHTVEYTGQADIGKTKHGTKHTSVKAVKRCTLFNRFSALTEYFPASVTFAAALRQMVSKANAVLPPAERIRHLAFDKEGWDTDLLHWLETEQDISPITWVKATAVNQRLLAAVPQSEFVPVPGEWLIGKNEQTYQLAQVADTRVTFPDLGPRRVVVVDTTAGTRLGIYTTARHPQNAALTDERALTTIWLLEALRCKQRIENGFKVETNELASDALPSHQVHEVRQTEPYDLAQAQHQLALAEKRLVKYAAQEQQYQHLLVEEQIDHHEFNLLSNRTRRLRQQTTRQQEQLTTELESVTVDERGQATRSYTAQVLDLRKLTLVNLFKTHALVALQILAQQLGLAGAGPVRLRREFLAFGDRVEFDHEQRIATVYAQRFPRARTQQAYEQLCAVLRDRSVTLERGGSCYQVRFSW